MKEVIVVGAAILKDGKVLAAQRSERMQEAFKWEFAGGKVEPGESHQQALRREIYEELEVEIEVRNFLAEGSYEFDNKKIKLYVYEAEIVKGTPLAKEHAQLEWVDIGKIENRIWAAPDLPACKKILENYL